MKNNYLETMIANFTNEEKKYKDHTRAEQYIAEAFRSGDKRMLAQRILFNIGILTVIAFCITALGYLLSKNDF